jgi:hypothetical protein
MRSDETSQSHSALGVVPEPRPASPWRVVAAEAIGDTTVRVTFADGTTGEVRLARLPDSVQVVGTVFEYLRDPRLFRELRVELGPVTLCDSCGGPLERDSVTG